VIGGVARVAGGLLAAPGATKRHQLARTASYYAVLKEIAPFSLLDDEKLLALRGVMRFRHSRRATILRSGTCAAGVYVLLAGRARYAIEDEQGRGMTLSTIEPHELFGDLVVVGSEVPWTGVAAISACETLYIPRAAFLACIDGNYEAVLMMLRLTEARLCTAQMKVAALGLLGVYERVARVLRDSAESIDGRWIVATGSEEIARSVAASREMVSRVLRQMHARGLVARDKRKLVILDRPAVNAACRNLPSGRTEALARF
jgi:CRP/FNR family cyclic AMP-dependent transcriptional regulator